MTTYELCQGIRRLILNQAAEVIAYHKSWGNEFSVKQMVGVPSRIKVMESYRAVQPNELTAAEMDDLGFGTWSESSPIRLIPLWLFPFLADEIFCGSISDETPRTIKKADMDNDNRMGCLAYGVIPKA